tara:strand:- start:347 stop:2560 length:2214 start_codon:yes stop_codon:yes gene_type:complete
MKKQIFIFILFFMPLFNVFCDEVPIAAEKLEILDEGNLWIGIGGVSLSWEDWEISSDELVLDYIQKQIIANGNVLIEKPEYMVYAESMDYDTQADYFKFKNARGFFPGEKEHPFYFEAQSYEGRANAFVLKSSKMTTCLPPCNKEWELTSRKSYIVPKEKIEAWGAIFWMGGVPVMYFPYIYLDLKSRNGAINITVGKNDTEGKFVKSSWYYTVNPQFVGGLMYDWTEKKGDKKGLTSSYWSSLLGGLGSFLYNSSEDPGTNQKNQIANFKQQIKMGNFIGSMSYSKNDTYLPNSFSGSERRNDENASFNLGWDQGNGAKTDINGSWRTNKNSFSDQKNYSLILKDNRKIGPVSWRSSGNFSSRDSLSQIAADEELQVTSTISGNASGYIKNWSLNFSKKLDPDGDSYTDDENRPFRDQLPSLKLGLSNSLWDNSIGRALGINRIAFEASKTKFGPAITTPQNPDPKTELGEAKITFSQNQVLSIGKHSSLTARNSLVQGVFDTGDAQYSIQPSFTLSLPLSSEWNTTFSHQYRDIHGTNPITTNIASKTNNLSWQTGFRSSLGTDFRFTTGFDFMKNSIYDPSLTYSSTPSKHSRLSLNWGWSLVNDQPRDLSLRMQTIKRGKLEWSMNTSWDMQDWGFKLKTLQSKVTAKLNTGFRIGLSMNHRFNSNDPLLDEVLVTKENCCTFWQLSWRRFDDVLMFTWGIKAFSDQPLGMAHGNEGFVVTTIPGQSQLEQGF